MSPTPVTSEHSTSPLEPVYPGVSWGAILGGSLAAIAAHIALTELGIACGLALYQPFSPDAPTASAVAWTTVIGGFITVIVALFFGGWVAGRLTNSTSWLVSGLHGVLAWATSATVVSLLVTGAVGLLAGGTAKAVGTGIGGVAQGTVQAVPEVAEIIAPNWDAVRKDVEEASRSNADGKAVDLAGRSRLMELLGSAFSLDRGAEMPDADRRELEGLVAAQTGLSAEQAAAAVSQWQRNWNATVERFESAKAAATEKAKQTAITAKRYTAALAAGAFAMMLLGACAAFFGAIYGHTCRFAQPQRPVRSLGHTGASAPA